MELRFKEHLIFNPSWNKTKINRLEVKSISNYVQCGLITLFWAYFVNKHFSYD